MSSNFGSSNSQEVDVNITPIIDCFTVLITFMLASASFLSIGFFEAYTPGSSADPGSTEPDTEAVIRIKQNQSAELKVKGKKTYTMSFDLKTPEGLKTLEQEIGKLEKEHLQINQYLLTAEDSVPYRQIASVMEQLNTSKIPVVVGDF